MLVYITVLLVCQLAGEVTAHLLGLPVPGPVIGMVLLFVALVIKGGVPPAMEQVCRSFLTNLSLLFVPAAVGVSVHFALLAREWLPITAAVLISTLATIAITGLVMVGLTKGHDK